MRALMIGVLLMAATGLAVAGGKAPAGQGRACDAKAKCEGALTCVPHSGGKSTCELVCKDSSTCPEDQRCVKDGAAMTCRPTTDL